MSKRNDLRRVKKIALEALEQVPGVMPDSTDFLYHEITDTVIRFRVQTWIASDQRLPWQTFVSDVIIALNTAFREHGVAVPDDTQVLVPGEALQQALLKQDDA